jgi:amino acid transporter
VSAIAETGAMTATLPDGAEPGLYADALGLGESVVMGVAGSGPAYSVAVSTAALVAAVGVLAPASLVDCGLIMFGVVFAFRYLNRLDVNAGASYAWVGRIFSPALGFFAGWSVIVSSILFMVSGTLPAATATLKLLAPALIDDQRAVTLVAALWMIVIGGIVLKGIKLSSYAQVACTVIEAGVLVLLIALGAVAFAHAPAHAVSAAWFTGSGFTPASFTSGALIALFAFSGWDVTVNLNEETRDGARTAGWGGIVAVVIVAALLIGFTALALEVLSTSEIDHAGINIVFAVAAKLLPAPWDYVAIVAVMLSTIGTLATSILQFTRTVFAMGRDDVLHERWARLHRTYRTPWFATVLITIVGLALLFLSSSLPSLKTVVNDSINALGFQVALYYGLAGFACAWHFRRRALASPAEFILLVAWPLLGAGFCIFIAAWSVPTFDLTTNVVGLGSIALGIVPYMASRLRPAGIEKRARRRA